MTSIASWWKSWKLCNSARKRAHRHLKLNLKASEHGVKFILIETEISLSSKHDVSDVAETYCRKCCMQMPCVRMICRCRKCAVHDNQTINFFQEHHGQVSLAQQFRFQAWKHMYLCKITIFERIQNDSFQTSHWSETIMYICVWCAEIDAFKWRIHISYPGYLARVPKPGFHSLSFEIISKFLVVRYLPRVPKPGSHSLYFKISRRQGT